MCWLWPVVGTVIGAILGYMLARSENKALIKRLTEDNVKLTAKLSTLAKDVIHFKHYRDQLTQVKTLLAKYNDEQS